ncbi:hypothetical protein NSED_08045 [Candidatus Nitrosopumilus sediminis]|uniref:Roadblock/LC7 family protein n=2 Tax=Candidatus Nitrosopumilus sediminis TaxID=1229909 RepID=K0BGQ1_9ARCH|nr:hypothetical protein NSED_08045 [Candidatus Nitrosopumilus sediminis]
MQNLCDKILDLQHVRFAGLISDNGNLYAGGFKKNTAPMVSEKNRQMMYMRFALESSFRKDFDDSFGAFRCSTIQREKISIITINICNYILLVFTEPRIDLQTKVKEIQNIIDDDKRNFLNNLFEKNDM